MQYHTSPLMRRFRGTLAGAAAGFLLLGMVQIAVAQKTQYTDVPAGAYYEDAAAALIQSGALDANEVRLRPSALATRAELVKLLVNLNEQELLNPAVASFNDVPRLSWYFPYFEAAASAGWVHGDGNCYKSFRPCNARPGDSVNRAEATMLLVRAFALDRTGAAMQFTDNHSDQWYFQAIQTAADHCVLQGDANTGLVRPGAFMNRAEMVVMFHRASQHLRYGVDCGTPSPHISDVSPLTSTRVQVTFTADINSTRAEDTSRYTVTRVSNGDMTSVDAARLIDRRTVELDLAGSLSVNIPYSLNIRNMTSADGMIFSDVAAFTLPVSTVAGHIASITPLSPLNVRVAFDTDLNADVAVRSALYSLVPVGGTGEVSIGSVTRIDSRTVTLNLRASLTAGTPYRVTARNLQTAAGTFFTDTEVFTSLSSQPAKIVSATAQSATSIQLTFDTDLDRLRAEQTNRFSVMDNGLSLLIRTADLVGSRIVNLSLAQQMDPQRSYIVNAQSMQTVDGVTFSDSEPIVNDNGSVSLIVTLDGGHQVPPVVTTAAGSGTLTLMTDGLHYDIAVKNMTGSLAGAGFFVGDSGVNGTLAGSITFTNNHASGVWTSISNDQRNAVLDGRVYVSVPSVNHPSGDIRGQLRKI